MLRSDPNAVVRQQALMVWKSVVEHTPATLKRTLSHFLITNQGPHCSTAPLINANVLSLSLFLSLTTGVLPKMMHIIIQCLGSSVLDKREVGGKTLGDLVNKLGDRILPDIIPILEEVQSAANLFLPFARRCFFPTHARSPRTLPSSLRVCGAPCPSLARACAWVLPRSSPLRRSTRSPSTSTSRVHFLPSRFSLT